VIFYVKTSALEEKVAAMELSKKLAKVGIIFTQYEEMYELVNDER